MKWIDACLQSLLASEYPLQVIVVDNNSADGTVAHVRERYPEVRVIANADNRGFGRANNQGIRAALDMGAEYVFLLNQDATVEPDTVGKLVQAHGANPEFGVISPVHLNGEGSGLDHNFEQYCLSTAIDRSSFQVSLNPESPQDANRSVNKLDFDFARDSDKDGAAEGTNAHPSSQNVTELHFINAAAWLITRACIEQIGGFHPVFFMYGEDHEFLTRASHAGFRSGVLTGAFIRHHRNQTPPEKSGVRKNLTSNYLANEARLIVLDPGLTGAQKRARMRRLYWRTVLRSVRFLHFGVFGLLRTIREAVCRARELGPEAAKRDVFDNPS
jgi:GT2 family glycosyltransferase